MQTLIWSASSIVVYRAVSGSSVAKMVADLPDQRRESGEGGQLRAVWAAADHVPVEKRGVFLERIVARLQLQRGFTDADLAEAARSALTGLIATCGLRRSNQALVYFDDEPGRPARRIAANIAKLPELVRTFTRAVQRLLDRDLSRQIHLAAAYRQVQSFTRPV